VAERLAGWRRGSATCAGHVCVHVRLTECIAQCVHVCLCLATDKRKTHAQASLRVAVRLVVEPTV
jgi:hypothetical protein